MTRAASVRKEGGNTRPGLERRADGTETTGAQWHVEANNQSGDGGASVTLYAYALCSS